MIKFRLNSEKTLYIISYIMIFIAILFSSTKNDFILGEFILTKMGLRVWSDETSGLFYPGVISLSLFGVGFTGILIHKKGFNKNFIVTIICIIVVGHLIYKPIFNFGYEQIRENMKGLASVEYIKQDSSLKFKSDNNSRDIVFEGQVKFQNYSTDKKEFCIKFIPSEFLKDLVVNEELIALDKYDKPMKYVIEPKCVATLNVKFLAKNNNKVQTSNGSVSGLDLVIFTDKDEEKYGELKKQLSTKLQQLMKKNCSQT